MYIRHLKFLEPIQVTIIHILERDYKHKK